MPRAYQAFHPFEVSKLIPASAVDGKFLHEFSAAVSAVPFVILLMPVVKRVPVFSDVRVAIKNRTSKIFLLPI